MTGKPYRRGAAPGTPVSRPADNPAAITKPVASAFDIAATMFVSAAPHRPGGASGEEFTFEEEPRYEGNQEVEHAEFFEGDYLYYCNGGEEFPD